MKPVTPAVTAAELVTKAQRQLREAVALLHRAHLAAPAQLARDIAGDRNVIECTERSLDGVVFALRDAADPKRGVR